MDLFNKKLENNDLNSRNNNEVHCPLCDIEMKCTKKILIPHSKNSYNCYNCKIEFLEDKDHKLKLTSTPKNTKLYYLNRFKSLDWNEWHKIGLSEFTTEENEKIASLIKKHDSKLHYKCPACKKTKLEHLEVQRKESSYLNIGYIPNYLICPECNICFKVNISDKLTFINYPKNNFTLWKYYDKTMTYNEIYNILNKDVNQSIDYKQENNQPKQIRCTILEEKSGIVAGSRHDGVQTAIVSIEKDYLLIQKESVFRGKDRGSRKILYVDITSVDFDRPSTFGITSDIEITVSGSQRIILQSAAITTMENFFNILSKTYEEYKLNIHKSKEPVITNVNQSSDADELMKWYQLKEQGIISEEEFNIKKKELIGL